MCLLNSKNFVVGRFGPDILDEKNRDLFSVMHYNSTKW